MGAETVVNNMSLRLTMLRSITHHSATTSRTGGMRKALNGNTFSILTGRTGGLILIRKWRKI
jgi:hypothetical protein